MDSPLSINSVMGGGGGQTGGGTGSNIIVDGIAFNGNNAGGGGTGVIMHLLSFWGPYSTTSSNPAQETGVIVQNCEFYNILTTTHAGGQNTAGIFCEGMKGTIIRNNYFHDINSSDPTDMGHVHGYEEYGCQNTQVLSNTFARCCGAIEAKEGNTGINIAYNYMFNIPVTSPAGNQTAVFFGMDGSFGNPNTGPAPIDFFVHHNVIDGCTLLHEADLNTNIIQGQPFTCYNNTVYDTAAGANLGWQLNSTANMVKYYNNIYYTVSGTGGGAGGTFVGKIVVASGGYITLDYNCYFQAASNYTSMWGLGTTSSDTTIAQWRTRTGAESHSVTVNPQFSAAIVSGSGPLKFKLGATSTVNASGATPGRVGGVIGGATQDMGAWGFDPALGTAPAQIGCNFGPYLG
jgi:hypothetical protein